MEKVLTDDIQKRLRESGELSANEIAIQVADIFVAENVLSKDRRRIYVSPLNEGRRILKG
jgi:hypothetical protein